MARIPSTFRPYNLGHPQAFRAVVLAGTGYIDALRTGPWMISVNFPADLTTNPEAIDCPNGSIALVRYAGVDQSLYSKRGGLWRAMDEA